jgi:hypothetical protein
MAFEKVFIDDSTDQRKEQFVVAQVFVAKLATWQKFQRKWNQTAARNRVSNTFTAKN